MLHKFGVQAHSEAELFVGRVGSGGVAAAEPTGTDFTAVFAAIIFLDGPGSIRDHLLMRVKRLDVKVFELPDLVRVQLF